MIKKLLIYFPFLLLTSGFAPMNVTTSSLDWQKIELEKNIINKVIGTISPVIRSGEYIVNVNIDIRETEGLKANGGGGGKPGIQDKPKPKKAPRIKFTDIDPSEANGDFIVLSKLGLEAPLYAEADEKTEEQSPESKEKSEAAEWQKFVAKYIETFDLARSVSKITVDVKLDNYLGEETKKTVEDLLNDLNLKFGKTKAVLKISYIDMKELKKEIDKRKDQESREFYEWIGKIGGPVGIILAVILLGIFALIIFNKYAALHEKQMEMLKNQIQQNAPQDKKVEDEEEKGQNVAGNIGQTLPENEDGIERFRAMLNNNPADAAVLIKRWINEPTKIHQNVLKCLVTELKSDELSLLFNEISIEGRKAWKRYIGKPIKPEEIVTAKRYVGAQVVQEMIIPNTITDPETVELLIRIKPEESAKFAEEEPRLAAILMNTMNSKFISKMMDKLSKENVQLLLSLSFDLSQSKIEGMLSEFKIKLASYIKTEDSSPFLEKLLELIPMSSPSRERTLYQGLAQTGNARAMLDLARGNFPSELIFKMPDVMIKQFSQLYPREKRTELVLILDDEYRSKYVSIIAPNQKTKDMIELDLANYEKNQVLKEKVLENKDALMQDFILHCRKQISTNPSHLKELQPLLIEWLDSFKMNEKAQDQKDVLKIAA